MRDYIEINGVNSNTIDGLLISTLPPISKPLMRTEKLEINGRDGDLVTKLGYSAYEKSFEIGLYGDYDVDDVISFFDTSGTVTFSNEPDKYYNFEMLDQIEFEKLIRFKTATVTMHVQPFKYSAVENAKTFIANLLSIPNFTRTTNGVTLTVVNNAVTVTGTSTAATEFYVPITALTLDAGTYDLTVASEGTLASACSIRLIKSVPSDADSFGGTYLGLTNDSTATLSGTLMEETTFNYVWFYITANNAMDFMTNISVLDDTQSLTLRNSGNINATPVLQLTGQDTIGLYLNDSQVFTIDLSNVSEVEINVAEMNAYYGDGTLANRIVTGDYDDFKLIPGSNEITWTGTILEMIITNYSRWI